MENKMSEELTKCFDCMNQVSANDMHNVYCNRVSRLVEHFKEHGYIVDQVYTLVPSVLFFKFCHGSTSIHYVSVDIDVYVLTYLPDEEFERWLDAEYERCLESEVQNGKGE